MASSSASRGKPLDQLQVLHVAGLLTLMNLQTTGLLSAAL